MPTHHPAGWSSRLNITRQFIDRKAVGGSAQTGNGGFELFCFGLPLLRGKLERFLFA